MSFNQAPPLTLQVTNVNSVTVQGTNVATLSAIVSNDAANMGVGWRVSCAGTKCGTFSPSHTDSGAATTYTAPSALPSNADHTVNITAVSTADPTKTVTANITLVPLPVTIAFTVPPPASLPTNATHSFSATVTNDIQNLGVIWAVTCGNSSCGSFVPLQTTSGADTTYSTPAAVPPGINVTITATAVADNTQFVSAIVTITGPPPAIVLSQAPPASMPTGTQAPVIATVNNDPQNLGVDWTVSCGVSSCGSFAPAHTASGATTTYTAPASVPTGNTVTITGTATADSTKTMIETDAYGLTAGSVLTQGAGPFTNASVSGNYAFTAAGSSGSGALATGGLFTSDGNGKVTAATLDVNNAGTLTSGNPTGTYSVAANGRGTLTLSPGTGGVSQFGVYVTASQGVLLLDLDTGTTSRGRALAQSGNISASTLSGNYAGSFDQATTKGEVDVVGKVFADGVSALIGVADINQFGAGAQTPSAALAGAFTANPNGRFTATLSSGPTGTLNEILYVVNNSTALFTEVDGSEATGLLQSQQFTAPLFVGYDPLPPGSMQPNGQAALTAIVANDAGNQGVDWAVSCGSPGNCGSFSATHTASGVSTTYTAPSSVPNGAR